jgi:hypothetical protein
MDTNAKVLPDLSAEATEIALLRAENAKLRAKAQAQATARIRLKVSEKGALSVYGLGRFPVTLYRGQWEKLLGMSGEINEFILDNSAALTTKD